MSLSKSKKEELTGKLQDLFENKFDEAYNFMTKKTFTPADQKEFKNISLLYAKSQISGNEHIIKSYEVALKAFTMAEAREAGEGFIDRLKIFLADAMPIVIKIVLVAVKAVL